MGVKQKGLFIKYFILNPTKDDLNGEASREAMLRYAEIIEIEQPNLSNDLRRWHTQCVKDIIRRRQLK